jgi:YYY domain-containing protein
MADVLAFILWYLAISVIGAAAAPIAFRALPRLADKGYAFSKPLGLLIWGFLYWLLVSFGVLQNDLGGEVIAFFLLLSVTFMLLRNGQAKKYKEWLAGNWKTLVRVEAVFLVFFAAWTLVRAANPDITYTEKPMELAFINAILKSPSFPPQDPWLSGYAISYYYFGYVIIAMLIRITNVVSGVGFNLTSAMWFGLTAGAAYGLVFDLLKVYQQHKSHSEPGSGRFASVGALLGPLFVIVAGNLEGLLEVLYARGLFWKVDGTSKFWSWLQVSELDVAPTMPASWLPNRPSGWLWWRGSRVIQDTSVLGTRIEIIDEFPFFSYLLSDLHPHVLAMPFSLLAIALCLNLFLHGMEEPLRDGSLSTWIRKWEFWFAALILGCMGFLNTWNFPIYVVLFCLTAIFLRIHWQGWSWRRLWEFLGMGITFALAGVLLFLPFYVGFRSQAGGFLPSLEFVTRGINFWIMFAVLLIPIFAWVIHLIFDRSSRKELPQGISISLLLVVGLELVSMLLGVLIFTLEPWGTSMIQQGSPLLVSLGTRLVAAGQAFGVYVHGGADSATVLSTALIRHFQYPGTWITLLILIALVWALLAGAAKRRGQEIESAAGEVSPPQMSVNFFVLIMVLLGALLTLFPEVFYLRDQFGTRMNTIFKFYFEAWVVWGIAAAFGSAVLLFELRKLRGVLFRVVWSLLIFSALLYPLIMVLNKTNNFKPQQWTLDGNAYIALYKPDEAEAIAWLEKQPMGVISEAVGGSYTPDSEWASIQTGYPTVLGWPGHESQWRGGATEMGSRQSDLEALYTTHNWEEAQAILQAYQIRYIYIGSYERSVYQVDEKKFAEVMTPAFQNGSVTIYQVPQALLQAAP